MNQNELWRSFITEKPEYAGKEYEAWSFGGDPDLLAGLAAAGIKTATASAYPLYALEGEPLPRAGDVSVIQDGKENALCIIETEKVSVVPFREVSARHAWMEGEGDRSLEYWRKVHEAFFKEEMSAAGLEFTEDMDVVCEEFRVIYAE